MKLVMDNLKNFLKRTDIFYNPILLLGILALGFILLHKSPPKDVPVYQQVIEVDKSDEQIKKILKEELDQLPGVSSTRVAVIHGRSFITQLPMMLFDVVYVMANPGNDPGHTAIDLPLSQWSDYLPALQSGDCPQKNVTDVTDRGLIERMKKINVTSFISCPLIYKGGLIGAVFVVYNGDKHPPEDTTHIKKVLSTTAAKISYVIASMNQNK